MYCLQQQYILLSENCCETIKNNEHGIDLKLEPQKIFYSSNFVSPTRCQAQRPRPPKRPRHRGPKAGNESAVIPQPEEAARTLTLAPPLPLPASKRPKNRGKKRKERTEKDPEEKEERYCHHNLMHIMCEISC